MKRGRGGEATVAISNTKESRVLLGIRLLGGHWTPEDIFTDLHQKYQERYTFEFQ